MREFINRILIISRSPKLTPQISGVDEDVALHLVRLALRRLHGHHFPIYQPIYQLW